MTRTREDFAELYVAGLMADAGWEIYFPRKDKGFDFIAAKRWGTSFIVRPVQVKGKFPTRTKKSTPSFGYIGKLTALTPDMVLAIAFFSPIRSDPNRCSIAWISRKRIRTQKSKGYRCCPAKLSQGEIVPKDSFKNYFDKKGLRSLGRPTWR